MTIHHMIVKLMDSGLTESEAIRVVNRLAVASPALALNRAFVDQLNVEISSRRILSKALYERSLLLDEAARRLDYFGLYDLHLGKNDAENAFIPRVAALPPLDLDEVLF